MVMETELLELCKKVYRRTGWGLHIANDQIGSYRQDIRYFRDDGLITEAPIYNNAFQDPTPLYTSDYLSDKLKGIGSLKMMHGARSDGSWTAECTLKHSHKEADADTLLKSMLKLVIKLDDSGELTTKGEK